MESLVRLGRASFALVAGLALFACKKEPAPAGEEAKAPESAPVPAAEPVTAEPAAPPAAPAAAASNAPAPGDGAAASSKISEQGFDLAFSASAAGYEAGKPGEAVIVLDAKPPYKVNDKYPYKLKLNDAPGVKFKSAVVEKDAVKLEKTRATMTVAFTPEQPGTHAISGRFSFSICTEEQCLIEKRDISLAVAAK